MAPPFRDVHFFSPWWIHHTDSLDTANLARYTIIYRRWVPGHCSLCICFHSDRHFYSHTPPQASVLSVESRFCHMCGIKLIRVVSTTDASHAADTTKSSVVSTREVGKKLLSQVPLERKRRRGLKRGSCHEKQYDTYCTEFPPPLIRIRTISTPASRLEAG